jgi:alpha,alpha-trehalase
MPAGWDIGPAHLVDYEDSPDFLAYIQDPELRRFAHDVHRKWPKLGRTIRSDRLCDGCVSSALTARHPFVVPGGRFREFYYLDTYFTIEGLLISGMTQTAKGMIENMLDMVDLYGFVPNGARKIVASQRG